MVVYCYWQYPARVEGLFLSTSTEERSVKMDPEVPVIR